MDWRWAFGTVIRNTGWTYDQCRQQCAIDVFELLEHLGEHPPAYMILAALHLKPKAASVGEMDFAGQMHEVSAMMGGDVESPPDDFGDTVAWVETMQNKLKG